MKTRRPLALVILLVVTFFAGGLVISTAMLDHPLLAQTEAPEAHGPGTSDVQSLPLGHPLGSPYLIADIAEKATPAVVLITVEWPAPERVPDIFDPWSWFFGWDFFGRPYTPRQRAPVVTHGSGFIFDPEGYIFTNQHVVGDPGQGQKVTVRLHPASSVDLELEAEIVGSDYELDLAILKLRDVPREYRGKLPTLPMGDSDKSRPGEWVIAIGNPYGYEHTVTIGVLSAKGREITIYDQERRQTKLYRDLLQTDAAINQGNSGGPLINIEGEVIGINTAVRADGQGIGFAIPINSALAVRDELIETGRVSRQAEPIDNLEWDTEVVVVVLGQDIIDRGRALLGVTIETVTEQRARELDLPVTRGALVQSVLPGSAAESAGIQPGDVIIRFGDVEIYTNQDVVDAVSERSPGQKVMVTLLRQRPAFDESRSAV